MRRRLLTLGSEKLGEHRSGFGKVASSPPHSLAFTLGLLSLAWGICVTFFPETWEQSKFYHSLVYFLPAPFVGVLMMWSGFIQVVASTNGIMLSRIAQAAIIVQACVWGAVSCSAAITHSPSTGTATYSVLTLLSSLLFWQWRRAARQAGKLRPV